MQARLAALHASSRCTAHADLAAYPDHGSGRDCPTRIAVKASSLPTLVSAVDEFPFPSLHEPIRRVVAAFGAVRVFWGCDLSRLTCSYEQLRDLFLEHLVFLDDDELAAVMGRGICRWLGMPSSA